MGHRGGRLGIGYNSEFIPIVDGSYTIAVDKPRKVIQLIKKLLTTHCYLYWVLFFVLEL